MSNLDVIDRRRHPDGVHRNHHGHAIYIIPGAPHQAKCNLCQQRVDGWPFQRTTTFIAVLESTFQLERWKMRQVVRGLVLKEHLVIKAAGSMDSDDAIYQVAEAAMEAADSSKGSDTGTGVHGITEAIDRGDEGVIVPASVRADIQAYRQLMTVAQLTVSEIECHVVIDGIKPGKTVHGISGTFDRIVETAHPCPACGLRRRVLDLKTTKTSSFRFDVRKIPMQLAAYAFAKRYDPITGERTELDVCQCTGLVLHLPVGEGQATLYTADLAAGRRGLQLAHQVWEWRQLEGLMQPVPLTAPATANGSDTSASTTFIHEQIAAAPTREALMGLWEQFKGHGWLPEHEEAGKRRLAEIEAAAPAVAGNGQLALEASS